MNAGDAAPSAVVRATPADTPALARVLARAFERDPWTRWFVRQDDRRGAALVQLFSLFLDVLALPHGRTFTTPSRSGAALWVPPGGWETSPLAHLGLLPRMLQIVGLGHVRRTLLGLRQIEALHPSAPHHYLFVLGVDPDHQRRGVGGRLLRPVLEQLDTEGGVAYLETSQRANLPFYERHGFRVRDEAETACGGPHLWTMLREPRSSSGLSH